jgi:hypothetical protein
MTFKPFASFRDNFAIINRKQKMGVKIIGYVLDLPPIKESLNNRILSENFSVFF